MPSLLREYRASTEASSSGVTFGRSAALGGGTNASPVTFIIEKPIRQHLHQETNWKRSMAR